MSNHSRHFSSGPLVLAAAFCAAPLGCDWVPADGSASNTEGETAGSGVETSEGTSGASDDSGSATSAAHEDDTGGATSTGPAESSGSESSADPSTGALGDASTSASETSDASGDATAGAAEESSSGGGDPGVYGTARFLVRTSAGLELVEYGAGAVTGPEVLVTGVERFELSPDRSAVLYRTGSGAATQWWVQDVSQTPAPAAQPVPLPMSESSFGTWAAFIPDGSGIMFDSVDAAGLRRLWRFGSAAGMSGTPTLVGSGRHGDFVYEGTPVIDTFGRWFAVSALSESRYDASIVVGSLVAPNPEEVDHVGAAADYTAHYPTIMSLPNGKGFVYSLRFFRTQQTVGVVKTDQFGAVQREEFATVASHLLVDLPADGRWLVGTSGYYLDPLGELDAQRLDGASIASERFLVTTEQVPLYLGAIWSPDGSWFTFATESEIRIVDMSGNTPGTPIPVVGASWGGRYSPTSDAFYFVVPNEGLHVMSLPSASSQLIAPGSVSSFTLSEDGESLAYVIPSAENDAHELFVLASEGSEATAVPDPLTAAENVLAATFSADGTTVVYRVGSVPGVPSEVHLFDRTGEGAALEVPDIEDALSFTMLP